MRVSSKNEVLFVTTELSPFASVGELADFSRGLADALSRQYGMTVLLPLYGSIDRERHHICRIAGLGTQDIDIAGRRFPVRFFRASLPHSPVRAIFVDCDELYGKPGIYEHPDTDEPHEDEVWRSLLLCRSAEFLMDSAFLKPNLLHLNGHQSAWLAALLRARESGAKDGPGILLTVHHAAYQGLCTLDWVERLKLDRRYAVPGGILEYFGNFNPLKAGVALADRVNAVSVEYARAIRESEEFGLGLEGLYCSLGERLSGIPNGVDTEDWNPETGFRIPVRFSRRNLHGKRQNKKLLLQESGLNEEFVNRPLVSYVGKLDSYGGAGLIMSLIDRFMVNDLTLLMVGTGQWRIENDLAELQRRYAGRFAVMFSSDSETVHHVLAGSDILLNASRFEPCGLSQLKAMRYGTIPVARSQGGNKDSIHEAEDFAGEGWGFLYRGEQGDDLLEALFRALKLYENKRAWRKVVRRAMKQDFSWDKSAEGYAGLYENILSERG